MTFCQAKIGRHECCKITATYVDILQRTTKQQHTLLLFCLTKGRVKFYRPETFIASFFHFIILICKVLINHFSKLQCVLLVLALKNSLDTKLISRFSPKNICHAMDNNKNLLQSHGLI